MRAVDIIAAAVAQVPEINEFISSSRFIQNYETDNNRVFPIAYLDRPLTIIGDNTAQGTIIERLSVTMLFADLQPELVDSIEAQANVDIQIESMRLAARKFITALQKDEQTELISSVNYRDVVNFFDANVCGIVLSFSIKLRVEFPYPCVSSPSAESYVVNNYIEPNYFTP
jgi:hypothetical protein